MKDIILAQRARNGDKEALDQLVRKYYPQIYKYIYRRTGHKELAEDLTQETFLKLTRAIGRYVPVAKFATFLYRIAQNTIIDHYRCAKTESEEIAEQWEEGEFGQVEDRILIESILKRIPIEQRECLILYYYQQLKYKEIAKILQIPVSTVKTRVRRGLEYCKKIMEQEERL